MSVARKCDRCGELFALVKGRQYIRLLVCKYEPETRYPGDVLRRMKDEETDLCPSCTESFNKWLSSTLVDTLTYINKDLKEEKENAED